MEKFMTIGANLSRYGVVFLLLLFGLYKFTVTEAEAIKPLIDNSFLFNWLNRIMNIYAISKMIGIVEIIAAIGIGLRFYDSKVAFYGSILGSIIFSTTLTFLFTTPGMIAKSEWLWLPDGFIIKDLVLLGFCLWSAGEAYSKTISNTL
jgi:reactive chlorine resistance protein C